MNNTNFDFTGKIVLITGGTGAIGSVLAEAFLIAGAKVYVASRSLPQKEKPPTSKFTHFNNHFWRHRDDISIRFFCHNIIICHSTACPQSHARRIFVNIM